MSLNIASMQAGLALLGPQGMSRPSGQTVTDVASIESRAVRLAKAQFTAPASTPPWQASASGTDSSRLAAVRAMKSLIDKPSSTSALGVDIDASFAIWKALDRLQLLARAATRATLLASERSAMAEQFSKGMAALQAYMATVDSRQLNLSFGQPARRVDTLAIGKPALGSGARGRGVATDRSAAIPGLDPARTLRVGVTRGGTTQHFDLALASLAQPPSLDHLAEALNTGLQGLAATARFSVEKAASKWHLALSAPASEAIAIDEVDAPDALIVAASDGVPGGAGPARVVRYDAPEAQMSRHLLGMIAATDRQAMLASAKPDTVIPATLAIRASVTDARGFTTLLATTGGDVGDQRAEGNGHRDLVLTRLDSRGQAVWQRMLGAVGDTEAAAFALAENGDVVVAATVAGGRDGGLAGGDVLGASDMVVSRYDSQGDVQFATLVALAGEQRAAAVALAADGGILVGGSANNDADAILTRLDAQGVVVETQKVAAGSFRGLALDAAGGLFALIHDGSGATLQRYDAADLTVAPTMSVALGQLDLRQVAVSPAGQIAVGGTVVAGVAGGQDAVVALLSPDLGTVSRINLGTSGTEQFDSLAFARDGTALYVGGRTSGALGGPQTGTMDGFIARLDMAAGGEIAAITQFGQVGRDTGSVQLSFAAGGAATVPEAIGFQRGIINANGDAARLVDVTRLRAGDSLCVRVGSGAIRAVSVAEDDTLASFASKVRATAGSRAIVTTPGVLAAGDLPRQVLRIQSVAGHPVHLLSGPPGHDALAPLGLEPTRIFTPLPTPDNAPAVKPGGQFGLALNTALNLRSADAAKVALARLNAALSTTQTGYRSLYWDKTKAQIADGGTRPGLTSAQAAKLDQYSRALDRLTSLAGAGAGIGL